MPVVLAQVRGAAWVGASLLALLGCIPTGDSLPTPIDVAKGLRAEYLAADAAEPGALVAAGGSDGRVFYTERETGLIRLITKEGRLLEQPFASVPVNHAGQRGLLGIALHPQFAVNGRVYVFYSRSDTGRATSDPQAIVDHRVVYFQAAGDVAATGEVFVASLPAGSGSNRIGGRIGFGWDGKLYVGLGDTGDSNAAQAADSLLGKILRYNDDGTIPADNPVTDSAVYARGLCEPRGLTFHPDAGVPFVVDCIPDQVCEINRIEAGKNYGWPAVAGLVDNDAEQEFAAQNADYVDPVAQSSFELSGASFNPSTKYGLEARLKLMYAVAAEGRVSRLEVSAAGAAPNPPETFATGLPRPVKDLAFSPAGTLYIACRDCVLRVTRLP